MGRPPSSGYCQTCRKRRVKCGKEVPECRRCLASGHKCGGYDLPMRMHVMGVHWDRDGTQRMAPIKVLPPKPSAGLPLVSFRDEVAAAFFFQTFSWAPFWRSHLLRAISSTSMPQIRTLNKACFQAITYTHMGLRNGDAALQIEGHQIYSSALTSTQTILANPLSKSQLAWLGETIILMGMYEFATNRVTGTGPEPPHHVGMAYILKRCGPKAFQTGPLLDLFRGCRTLLICKGICSRTRTFLEDEKWKTIPWEHAPKTFEDRLMDILVDLPGIAEDLASPPAVGDDRQAACRVKIVSHLTGLRQWRREWNIAHTRSIRTVTVEGEDDILPTRLVFSSTAQAAEIMLYNEALLFLTKLGAMAHMESTSSFALRMTDGPGKENLSFVPSDVVEPRLQPALETLMAMGSATKLFASSDEKRTVMTPAPLAAVYITLMEEPALAGKWDQIMAKYFVFEDAEVVFAGYMAGIGDSWT
ncbi:hypothetical protein QBC39DRAFT_280101 [Podospora conica]|nr:hypothetical protein QBC39DRAFT_280101 [Schizothecium conicum]